ncbi:hypothetical protein BDP27DRAFT_388855 [Rhodocollybia butyracea]|uniref:RBR-type E3 ubiquitin transferase n=1 Tax=Rhodocollybia butyracea TaxID=206335 RepID=A0A9P5PUR2_9AGAR|nr:hypothetical protein BDP27DRAFT_388855 [Rhodocollybia butyracea]
MFPPKCCGNIINLTTEENGQSLKQSLDDLNPSLGVRLRARAIELDVPPKDRLYCPSPRCSAFLGSWSSFKNRFSAPDTAGPSLASGPAVSQFHQCPSCSGRACVLCKEPAHLGATCRTQLSVEEELMENEFRNLAREKSWQTCPGCSAVVELTQGCSHITCRCRSEFCYACGSRWKGVCICRV